MFPKIHQKIINNEENINKPKRRNNNNNQKINSISPPSKSKNKPPIFAITKIKDTFPDDYRTRRFILLDTETTGLEISSDRLISINAVEMINSELTGIQFNAYLDKRYSPNTKPLMYYLSDYNYSRKDNIKKSLQTFLDFVKDDMIITHNANFDTKFINRELNKYKLKEISLNRCICTLKYFRNLKKMGIIDKNYGLKLCDLCHYYDIDVNPKDLHQGIVDTIVFGRVVAKMFDDGVYNYNDYDYGNNFKEINNLGRSFIDLHISDLYENNQEENFFDNENNINIRVNNNLEKNVIKNNNHNKKIICKSEEKKRKKKLNNNNFSFNKYNKNKKNKNNYYNNKNGKKKNNIFKSMNYKNIIESSNKETPPKKKEAFYKSKSQPINYEEDNMKINFIKNAFKSYISSNKIK